MPKRTNRTRSRTKPPWQTKIAEERIEILFDEARKIISKDPDLAKRYVQLARKIGMRYNVRIPSNLRMHICRKCKGFLYPGVTSRQYTKGGFIKIKCLACGRVMTWPIRPRS